MNKTTLYTAAVSMDAIANQMKPPETTPGTAPDPFRNRRELINYHLRTRLTRELADAQKDPQ